MSRSRPPLPGSIAPAARQGRRGGGLSRFLVGLFLSVSLVLVVPAAIAEANQARLFGSKELPSGNLKRFPKWTGMLERFKDGTVPCESDTCTSKGWKETIDSLRGKDLPTLLKEVNRTFNSKPYILDIKNWGEEDYWATPYQFLKKSGDCEDYAIAKYMALKALGVPVEQMRVVAVQDLNLRIGHAVLVVYVDGEPMMLDNQISAVVRANSILHYEPVFSLNEKRWWLHRK